MAFFILGVLAIIMGIIRVYILSDADSVTFWNVMLCICGGVLLGLSIAKIKQEKLPTPLDVYRDKTTLEISYRDGIPVDSAVVFKNQ